MGIVEWWNSGMVERWNGGIDACVVSSTFLVHMLAITGRNLYHGEMKFWHERYL